jgi:flagellar hook-associated protein 3 FlgL
MRVTFSSMYRRASADIARVSEEMALRQTQVTSGKRVLVPSDDPSAMVGMVGSRTELATLDRYERANDSVTGRLTVADTVLSDILLKIQHASAVLTSAQGSVINDTHRASIVNELRGIRDGIYSSIVTQFHGTYLFSGTETTTAPYSKNPDGSISASQGNAGNTSVDVDRQTTMRVTFDGGGVMQGSAADDLFTTIENLMTAVGASDSAAMATGSLQLTAAFERVTILQTQIGIDLAAIEDKRTSLTTAKLAAKARLSAHEDVNMVDALTGMTQAETAYKAALSATSTIARLSLLDYL